MQGLPDLIVGLMTILLGVALIPTIVGKAKPEHSTAIFSAGALAVIALAFYTMGSIWSTLSTLLSAVGWLVLAVQTRK